MAGVVTKTEREVDKGELVLDDSTLCVMLTVPPSPVEMLRLIQLAA